MGFSLEHLDGGFSEKPDANSIEVDARHLKEWARREPTQSPNRRPRRGRGLADLIGTLLAPEDVRDSAERVSGDNAGEVSRSALWGNSYKLLGRGGDRARRVHYGARGGKPTRGITETEGYEP
jgi:hypothetical protein